MLWTERANGMPLMEQVPYNLIDYDKHGDSLHTPKHPHFTQGEPTCWIINGYIYISSTNGIRWTSDTSPLTSWWIPTVLATSREGAGQLVIGDRESCVTYSNKEIGQAIDYNWKIVKLLYDMTRYLQILTAQQLEALEALEVSCGNIHRWLNRMRIMFW